MRKQSPPPPELDDLASLSLFARVADEGSFSAAARATGASTSAVSKRIAKLEDRLGVRLLERTTRRVSLTEAGQTMREHCNRILGEVEAAQQAVGQFGEEPRGTLRISGPVIYGEMVLAPLIPAFLMAHPALRVDLSLNDRFVNVIEEGFDIAIRVGRLADSSLVARRLTADRRVVCASADYLRQHGTPQSPDELRHHNCLRYSLVSPQNEWRFLGKDGEFSVSVRGNFQSDHGGAIRESVIHGLGIALLPSFIIADALRDRRVVEVLEGYPLPQITVHAVFPAGRHPAPKVRAFIDFLAGRLSGDATSSRR